MPTKITSKEIQISFLVLFLIFLPFKNVVETIFIAFSNNLLFIPQKYSKKAEELEKQNLILTLELRKLENLKEENEQLKKVLKFKEENKINILNAGIISFDPSNWRRIVVINKGKNNGIKEGLYAINNEGQLIGKVIEVKDNYSRLILIDDPEFNISVFIGDKSFGLLQGALGGAKILYIENQEEVNAQDKIWVRIPAINYPIYVGEVKQLKKDNDSLFWDIEVKLFSANPFSYQIFIVNE